MRTLSPRARQLELDMSDADRHAYTLSELDENRVLIDEIAVFGNKRKAERAAEQMSRETSLPLVIRTVHPAFG